MIAIPAVDLREGSCVQLVGGDFADERVRLPNPVDVARRWRDAGFTRLHVVDLDAAMNSGDNRAVIEDLVRIDGLSVAVGGGVRTDEHARALIESGADWIVVGTRAIEEPAWLNEVATRFPGRIVVAADVRGRSVVVRGWTHELDLDILDFASRIEALPLAGVLITAVHREGQLRGPDLELVDDVVRATTHPVIASGGIASVDDLRALEARGASACVIGMALYTGALEPRAVASEFNA